MTGMPLSAEGAILLTGVLLAVAAALPGCFLVLRGSALLSDAIGHAVVFGVAVTWLATGLVAGPVQVAGAGAAGLVTVMAIEALTGSGRLRRDAAMGLVYPTLFAAGVLIINLFARRIHLDIDTVLLGEIAFVWLDGAQVFGVTLPRATIALGTCAVLNAAYIALFWKELKCAVFDPDFARLQGMRPGAVMAGLLALTSVTAVAALDAVGAILFVAFVVVPAATARLLTRRLSTLVVLAAGLGGASAVVGHHAAFAADVSIGGMMALTTGGFFTLALLAAPQRGVPATILRRRERRLELATRTLLSHLLAHAEGPHMAEENTVGALRGHLRWSSRQAARVVLRGLDKGLIRRDGTLLSLTPLGREAARYEITRHAPADSRRPRGP